MSEEWILLAEDDENLSFILKRILESRGYRVTNADCVKKAVEEMEKRSFDLVLLDMLLPDGDGTELCARIRRNSFCPIIFVSCIADRETKIRALEMGGDDYIVKPIDFEDLFARIQVNIRRAKQYNFRKSASEEERYESILVRKKSHEVWLLDEQGKETEQLDLSPTEYGLLLCFLEQPKELLLYQKLYHKVWEADDLGDIRTVMVHVSNLRRKMGECGKELIHTVRGAGYIFGTRRQEI